MVQGLWTQDLDFRKEDVLQRTADSSDRLWLPTGCKYSFLGTSNGTGNMQNVI